MQTTRDRKVWSVHSLHRPYENAEPAGIRPIAKRFSMAGCRKTVPLAERLRNPLTEWSVAGNGPAVPASGEKYRLTCIILYDI